MSLASERKEQRQKLAGKPLKEKIKYFFYYEGLKVAFFSFIGVLVIWFAVTMITKKDPVLTITFLNATNSYDAEQFTTDFITEAGFNPKKETIQLDVSSYIDFQVQDDSSVVSQQRLTAQVVYGTLDCVVANEELVHYLYASNYLRDLRQILSEEEIKKYEACFYYMEAEDKTQIPIAVALDESVRMDDYHFYQNQELFFTFIESAKDYENSVKMLEFLTTD